MADVSVDAALIALVLAGLACLLCWLWGVTYHANLIRSRCPHPPEMVRCVHGDERNYRDGVAFCALCAADLHELPEVCSVTRTPH